MSYTSRLYEGCSLQNTTAFIAPVTRLNVTMLVNSRRELFTYEHCQQRRNKIFMNYLPPGFQTRICVRISTRTKRDTFLGSSHTVQLRHLLHDRGYSAVNNGVNYCNSNQIFHCLLTPVQRSFGIVLIPSTNRSREESAYWSSGINTEQSTCTHPWPSVGLHARK